MNLCKKTIWIFCANFLAFIMIIMAYATESTGPLIFAGDMNYPPFESIRDDQPVGINIDILRALSKVMHRDIEIQLMKWSEAQQMLKDGKVDALTEMAYTESRAEFFDFSEQTVLYKYSFFIRKDDENIQHLSDLEGKIIAVTKGGYPRQFLKSNKKNKFYIMESYLDGFKQLLAGAVNVVAADYWVGGNTLEENNLKSVIKFETHPFAEKPGFIPVKKGNTALLNEINQGIAKLRKEGIIQGIFDKWSGKSLVFITKEKLEKLKIIVGLTLTFISILFIVFWIYILKRQLKSKTADLQEAHDNLESEVQKRTISLQREITDHKLAEEALCESEEKLNALFTSLTEIIVMHELVLNAAGEAINYRIIDCNKVFTEVTGISKEDAIGKLATEVYQTNPPPYMEKYAKVGLGGEPHEFNIFYPPLDKHFMISVVSPQAGKFATITTDISDMMRIQEMIMAKNKEMENYLYIASHDLRTPLVNIQGFSQRLKKQADSIKTLFADKTLEPEILHQLGDITDKNIPKTLSFILSNIEKMDTLINGLLQLSRTGRVEMNIQKIDMNELFATILQSHDFQIKEAQCEIHIDPLPECYGDAALLDQLFANIISNALKYSDSGRVLEITVGAKKTHNRVVYAIRDTGKGIAQKHLDKIWDIFYRIDPRSSKTGEGLGLSLVKRIAEKHKGKVWAESKENKGSVFHIELNNRSFTEI